MTDLYDTLGVAKDATKDAIKKAFRARAKAAHPDTGGSAETFHAIELAHRVLTDDARRAEYDRTGAVDDQPDNADGPALSIIASFVDQFLADEQSSAKDMIGQFRRSMKQDIETAKGSDGQADAYIARALKAQTKLKGEAGAELIRKMIANKITQAEQAKQQFAEQIKIRERALELIADASFDFDKVDLRAAQMNQMYGMSSSTNNFWR